MRPQESGNKVGVRWMKVSGATMPSLTVKGMEPLSANVLAFPYDDLARRPPGTWRSSDIKPHGDVTLLIDKVQSGVGGTDSWSALGRPLEPYRIPVTPHRYGFTLSVDAAGVAGVATTGALPATATDMPIRF